MARKNAKTARKNYDNPVREALIESDYDWSDPSMVRSALISRENPLNIGPKELAAVTGVGLVLALISSQVAIPPVVAGTGLYLLGYYIRGERPSQGWPYVR